MTNSWTVDEQETILIVDDELASVQLLSHILKASGYQVQATTRSAEALQIARTQRLNLILLDVMMPGLDGFEVCRQLKANESSQDVPVLFLSALADIEDKIRAFGVGAADYITKPFQSREILARVATHLALRSLQQRLEAANQELERQNAVLQKRNEEMEQALQTIKTLSGLIPICAWCGRKIEDEAGQWVPVEVYIQAHSQAHFTHGMCPDCFRRVKEDAELMMRSRTAPTEHNP